MDVDQIFEWILKHNKNYPGRHQESQPRTVTTFKPLEPKAQFHIIFRALTEYIRENMEGGKSVNLRGLGAFSFEIESDKVKPAIFTSADFKKGLDDQRAERKHVHQIRPCFIVDSKFKYLLSRYPGKVEIDVPKSQHSVFQQGFGMIFCNPVPIAGACYLAKEVVSSALAAFVQAVNDLTKLGYSLRIDFGFCQLQVVDRNLNVKYNQSFGSTLNRTTFENKLRRSDVKTAEHWRTSHQDKWMNSTLGTMLKKPPQEKTQTLTEKTLALKIMSLDLNSAEKTFNSRAKSVGLPKIESRKIGGGQSPPF